MATDITFSRHSRIAEVRQEWEFLDRMAGENGVKYAAYSFYQTYTWSRFLYGHIAGKMLKRLTTRLVYILMRRDGEPFAILPLSVTRSSGKVRFPSCWVAGILNASIPHSLIGGGKNEYGREMAALRGYIEENFPGCHLSLADVPQCTLFARLMRSMEGGDFTERTSYHVPLSAFSTVDEYIGSLSKNIYKNIRKAYNHLKTDGREMALKVYTKDNLPGNGYLYRLWRMYFVRKLAWREKRGTGLNMLAARIKAMLEVGGGCATQSLRKLAESRLYVLEIDSRPAAFMIVYAHRRHLLMPRLAISKDFGRYSPGIIMLLEAVKLWLDEGFVDFDMCRGDERYKTDMGGVNEPLCRIERMNKS